MYTGTYIHTHTIHSRYRRCLMEKRVSPKFFFQEHKKTVCVFQKRPYQGNPKTVSIDLGSEIKLCWHIHQSAVGIILIGPVCFVVDIRVYLFLNSRTFSLHWSLSSLADPGAGEGDALSAGVPEVLWANAQCKQGLERLPWSQTIGLNAQRETPQNCRHPCLFLLVKTT